MTSFLLVFNFKEIISISTFERLRPCVHRTASFHAQGKLTVRGFNLSPLHGMLQLNEKLYQKKSVN